MERRMAQIEESVARYLEQLDTADRQEPSEALQTKTNRLKEKACSHTGYRNWETRCPGRCNSIRRSSAVFA